MGISSRNLKCMSKTIYKFLAERSRDLINQKIT
jgi:hypothetical protein